MEPEMTLSVPMTLHIERRTQTEKSFGHDRLSLSHTQKHTRGAHVIDVSQLDVK